MKNTLTESFATQMKKRRRELGITQRALAERLNYSEKAISKWESAAALPPSNVLPSLSAALGCGIDDLFSSPTVGMYYLGIDGGGTKTDFVLIDGDGKLIKKVKLGASNPVDLGIEKTLECLGSGINRACAGIPFGRISMFAGIAGGSTPEYKNAILKYISGFGFLSFGCGSDADNIVEAGLFNNGKADDGIVVIMGTGSVAFARKGGVKSRFGGYGYLLGDAGCGFSVGRDSVTAALFDEEGSGEHTLLTEMVRERCGKSRVLDALGDYYKEPKKTLAAYAPLAIDAYKLGDPVAERILIDNITYIAKLIAGAAKQFESDRVRVVLAGGFIARGEELLPLINDRLNNSVRYEVSIYKEPPVLGALILAGAEKIEKTEENENA